MIRTFIAIDLPKENLEKINNILTFFKSECPEKTLRWVSLQNLHLTIKFLGDIPEKKLTSIKSIIQEVARRIPRFRFAVKGLGMYPNQTKPRVIWLGIETEAPMYQLHHLLDDRLKAQGIKPEKRKFSPHLTIARVSNRADYKQTKQIANILSKFTISHLGAIEVDQIHLYKSQLTPQGPIYSG